MAGPRRWVAVLVTALLAAMPVGAFAHAGHGASAWAKQVAWEGEVLRLVIEVLNESGGSVTLRRIECAGAKAVVFTRSRSLFGFETEQPVERLLLDPDELVRLGEGRYRLEVTGVEPGATQIALMLDFGPDGALLVPVELPPR